MCCIKCFVYHKVSSYHFETFSSFRESFITFRCDARSRWRELSMTRAFDSRVSLWFKNEWNIRHTIFFFRSSNLLICFQSIRFRFVRIFIKEFSHYIECISKFFRIISDFILIVLFLFDKKLNSTIVFANVENIIRLSFFLVIYNYRRRELVDLFKEWIFERLSQKIRMKNVKNLDWLEQLNLIKSINNFNNKIRFDHFVIEFFRKSIRDNVFNWDFNQIFYFIFDIFSMFVCIDHLFFLCIFYIFCNKFSDFVHFFHNVCNFALQNAFANDVRRKIDHVEIYS